MKITDRKHIDAVLDEFARDDVEFTTHDVYLALSKRGYHRIPTPKGICQYIEKRAKIVGETNNTSVWRVI